MFLAICLTNKKKEKEEEDVENSRTGHFRFYIVDGWLEQYNRLHLLFNTVRRLFIYYYRIL